MVRLIRGRRHVFHQEVEQRPQVLSLDTLLSGRPARLGVRVDDGELDLRLVGVQVEEQLVDLVDHVADPCVRPVDLVHHEHHRQPRLERLPEHEASLRQRPLGGVDEQHHAVDHRQPALDLAAEVGVAGRVDQVELHVAVPHRGVLGEDRDAALALLVHRVEDPVGQLLVRGEHAGLAQHGVDKGGLAMVDVRDDRDVADVGAAGHSGSAAKGDRRPSLVSTRMEHRTLGRTGVKVSPLCLGAMMFGAWGERDHDESVRIIHRALDAGINFVDTADVYSAGESEEIVGKALAGGRRDNVVLATKVHGSMGEDPNQFGNSRRWIVTEVENSLRRLKTAWIDLYQIHRPEDDTDIDETLGALTDLVRAGKVRYIGSSTFPASQIVEAQWTAERRARERFVSEQPPYSMLIRGIEHDVLPTCRRHGIGAITWSPLAAGWLSGRWRKDAADPTSRRSAMFPKRYDLEVPANQRKLDAADALAQLAEEAGMTLIELALAFVIRHPAVTSAIIGPRTMEHLESQLTAVDVELSDDVLDRIDEIVPPGTNVNPTETGYDNPALGPEALRRPASAPRAEALR